MSHRAFALLSLFVFAPFFGVAQEPCEEGQHAFSVVIAPDSWPGEMSWTLTNGVGDLLLEADVQSAADARERRQGELRV